jgi:hypothetical protein
MSDIRGIPHFAPLARLQLWTGALMAKTAGVSVNSRPK